MSRARMELVALAAGLLLLAGCGSDGATATDGSPSPSGAQSSEPSSPGSETSSPSASPSPDPGAGAPECRDVWKHDARLPRGYQGCNEGRGAGKEFVPRQVLPCSSGQRIVTYADHYWSVLGGTIHHTESRLSKDPGYGDAVARCRG